MQPRDVSLPCRACRSSAKALFLRRLAVEAAGQTHITGRGVQALFDTPHDYKDSTFFTSSPQITLHTPSKHPSTTKSPDNTGPADTFSQRYLLHEKTPPPTNIFQLTRCCCTVIRGRDHRKKMVQQSPLLKAPRRSYAHNSTRRSQ